MRRTRSALVALVIAFVGLWVTAGPALADHAPGIKGVWVRGGSTQWQTANSAFGPLHSARIFYGGALPASYVGSVGSDLPDDVTLVVSYNTADTNLASFICSIPDTRNVILSYWHEPEQQNTPFPTGASFVSAFSDQSAKARLAATTCGVTTVRVAMIALSWSYAVPTRRGYSCSFIPPESTVDYYLADTYDKGQLSLAHEPGFQKWARCTAGSVPRGLAEHGIGLGNATASGCQFTDARRATVLQADDAYLAANFPGFVLWEYSWPRPNDTCWMSWQFPAQGQSADTWRAIVTDAALPPVILLAQPAPNATARGTLTVSGTVSGSADIAQVLVSIDGGTPAMAAGSASWSDDVDTTALPDGAHTLTVQATDVNGTVGTATVAVTVANTRTSCPALSAGMTELSGNTSLESALTGWTGLYNANSTLVRVAPTGGSYDGNWALRIAPKAIGAAGVNNTKPQWVPGGPGVATVAGHAYTGSAFVQANAVGEKVTIRIRENAPTGALVSTSTVTMTLGDTGWHQVSANYTAKKTGDRLAYILFDPRFATTKQQLLADCLSLQTAAS